MAEFIEVLSPTALADLEKLNAKLIETVSSVDKINAKFKTISTPSGVDSATNDLSQKYKELEATVVKLQTQLQKSADANVRNAEKTRLAEIKLAQDREKAFDKYEKQLAREQAKLKTAEGAYQRIQNGLNSMTNAYRDLAIRKELNGTLTKGEEKQFAYLQARIQKFDTALKAVDASMGKYQRNVGNYSSAFNPLNNSINQLTREMPAFANSVQTGFMAISNNLPIFFDSMQQVIAQNKELQKQGQPTKSLFSQLAGAVFSWGTALSVGVTLLTIYGKDIAEFASNLIKGGKAIDVMKESQKQLNEINVEGQKNAVEEQLKLKTLLEIAKDTSLSYKERMIAVKELQDTYPAYFGNLKQEKILAGETRDAENELTQAILSRAKANSAVEKITENQGKIIDLEEKKIKLSNELTKAKLNESRALQQATRSTSEASAYGYISATGNVTQLQREIKQLDNEIKDFTDVNNRLSAYAIENQKKSIKLDQETTKVKKEKIDLNFKEVESEYELRLSILERQRAESSDRMNNENSLLDARLRARKDFSEKSIEILNIEMKKEIDTINLKFKNDLDKNNLAYKNKEISSKIYSQNLIDITKTRNNNISRLDSVYSLKFNELLNSDKDFFEKIQKEKDGFSNKSREIQIELEKNKFKKIYEEEDESKKKTLAIRQKAFDEFIKLSKKELDVQKAKELANAKSNEEIDFITQKYKKAFDELEKLESPMVKSRKEFEKYLDTITKGNIDKSLEKLGFSSLKMLLDFDKNGQSTFEKLMESADSFGEKFAVTFQVIGDIAQETFAFISQLSQQRFKNEYDNLAKEKEIALAFAGESTEGRAEIERQFQERQSQIKRREFKAKQQEAMFNIAVDTAQAIVGAIAKSPMTGGLPWTAIIASLGAIQLGVVASQQIPQYWTGTDNAQQGWAWTQEKGREIITDKNGRIKSTGSDKGASLTYLNKGDKVYNAQKSALMFDNALNGLLMQNGITQPKVEVNNVILDSQVDRIVNAVGSIDPVSLNIDKRGLNAYVRNGHSTKEIQNLRITGKGRKV
jgi:hypothetical protein